MPGLRDRRTVTDRRRGLLLAGIVLVALNLRPALAAVGPLVGEIRATTGLSDAALGMLTTLPLLAFGVASTLTPLATRALGMEGALAAALLLLAAGTAVRATPSVALLYGGTALLGLGIAVGNVLLPALVKRDFAARSGGLTSLYSSVMALGAAVAAGISVPLAGAVGWRGALAAWAIPAAVALGAWSVGMRAGTRPRAGEVPRRASVRAIARSALAWRVALYMGLQSLTFYVALAWLPDLLQARGLGAAEAGWLLALSQATGIVGSAIVPLWAARVEDQRSIVWVLAALEAVALAGLLLPDAGLAALWVTVLGVVLGGTFSLSLLLLVLRAADAEIATGLSAMAQSVGYLVAATGPALFGLLHQVTLGWSVPLLFLVAVLVAKVAAGVVAGRPGMVRHPA